MAVATSADTLESVVKKLNRPSVRSTNRCQSARWAGVGRVGSVHSYVLLPSGAMVINTYRQCIRHVQANAQMAVTPSALCIDLTNILFKVVKVAVPGHDLLTDPLNVV